jgi:hypothetical protein
MAAGLHYGSNVSCGDPEAAAQLHDGCAAAQESADHPCLGTLICSPEHLCPNLWGEVGAPSVKPETLVANAFSCERADDLPGPAAGHQGGNPKLQRRCGDQFL